MKIPRTSIPRSIQYMQSLNNHCIFIEDIVNEQREGKTHGDNSKELQ